QAQREQVRDHPDAVRPLAGEAPVERGVGLGQGHRGRDLDVADLDVLAIGDGGGHVPRFSTSTSVSPSWTTSSRWLTTVRWSVTSPRSGLPSSRLASTRARRRTVSPILIGPLNFHRKPTNASVAYALVARDRRP